MILTRDRDREHKREGEKALLFNRRIIDSKCVRSNKIRKSQFKKSPRNGWFEQGSPMDAKATEQKVVG